ncbi:helix-turn-helix transcriptional regulator [Companilactobacillus ginsenosidimutans]|uniref:CBS domain-containing protein n=1 Tax=Companilactobacillus ginsenosidimutans TaxID=1007676 RepID=A0A0H4QGV8_9LACO|nr:helix-turn-helix transcriptional regulator [Companilactobacillus ginsenosidimutans]AKP67167.1 CBS domain-containing protein [Companilactobacillus ginsenosidimutans]
MELTKRQKEIIAMTKKNSPLTSEKIANQLNLSVPTIRGDLRLLTAVGILGSRPKVGYEYTGMKNAQISYGNLYDKKITDILKRPAFVEPSTSLQECVNSLFLRDTGSLYVIDDNKDLLGLISRKDLLAVTVNNGDTESMTASMVMTRMPNLITVTSDMTIMKVGKLLLKHEVDSLPVVEKENSRKVVGKITKNRIFQYFVEQGNKNS